MDRDIEFVKNYSASYKKYHKPDWKSHIENFSHDQAPAFLLDFKRTLDKGDLKFWLIWGTALGAYREGAVIAHDHDMDLAIRYEDRDKLTACTPALIELGITPWLIGVAPDGLWFRYGRKECFTDVVLFDKIDGKYRCMKWVMDYKQLDVEERVSFLGESFLLPSEPEKYFTEKYGADWKTPIKDRHCVS